MKLMGLALLVAVCPAWAQFGTAGAPPTVPGWSHAPLNFGGGVQPGRPFPGSHANVIFVGQPWLEPYNAQPAQTTYIVLQPQAAFVKTEEQPRPITPMLIELRGDRFVRTTSGSPMDKQDERIADHALTKPRQNLLPVRSEDVMPVVLVFRDGHRELVRDYSIIGGNLYASADYVQSGVWMKTIRLSALNLPVTLEVNREAGAPFVLPSGPNVVVARP